MDVFRFRSDLFEIEPGEDEEINPRMYGRQLSRWLKSQLEARGYDVEPAIEEDWGRCLMLSREPFDLWVGCGSMMEYGTAQVGDPPPAKDRVTWTCFSTAEVPWFKRWFGKVDTAPALAKLDADLEAILRGEARIRLVE